ncbi:MAG: glycosyltransferase family 1 protein [Bacteroidales bacterium]|jgi:glycosyltransferase involved in cell wall biosynthesis
MTPQKNIGIYLSSEPKDGGKFQYSMSILEALAFPNKNFNVTAFYLDENWKKYIPNNINKFHIKISKFYLIIKIIRKIILFCPLGISIWRKVGKLIDSKQICFFKKNIELILFPGNDSLSYLTTKKTIAPIHDLMHIYEKRFKEVGSKKTYNSREKYYKNVCKYSKAIFVDSELGKKHVLENYKVNYSKIYVVPYNAPSYVSANKENNDELLKSYNLPDKFIFYPAQFWEHKNHRNLIKAIFLLKKQNLIINVVLVGSMIKEFEYVYKEALSLISNYKLNSQIYILGYVNNEELVQLYKRAIALIMPTFFGPTNIPPLEAFALGCPVLTSNIYAIPEQVGNAALLFDPNDYVDIAEKIKIIYSNIELRNNLTKLGNKRSILFSQEKSNNKVNKIIFDLLK